MVSTHGSPNHYAEAEREPAARLCGADYAPALLLQPHGFEGFGAGFELTHN